jgi:uncharacterized protein (TIGR02271 family)
MPLYKIKDFDPNYRNYFDNQDILGFDLYSGNEKVGSIDDLLVDDNGKFRYFVINTGIWVFGKKVLLPVGRARVSYSDRRIYVDHLTREQVENLPEYRDDMVVDYDYEERVRNVYRPTATAPVEAGSSLEATPPLETTATGTPATHDRTTYNYTHDPALYDINERDHQQLRLYEERLVANKHRQKTGEVIVGKRVETDRARVEVPLEHERVVIEQGRPTDVGTPVAPGEAAFQEGEVARMEVYEEVPDIRKEAYVREQVNIRKEVQRDQEVAEDEVRRERLDIKTEGSPVVDQRPNP